jgi:hypothetical protein
MDGSDLITITSPPSHIAASDGPGPELHVPRPSFGTLLMDAGLITREQLYQALAEGTRTGERLGEVLIRHGLTTEEDVARILSEQFQLPFWSADDAVPSEPDGWDLLPPSEARRLEACLVQSDRGVPVAALADPSDARFNSLRQALGEQTSFAIVTSTTLASLLDRAPAQDLVEELSAAVVPEAAELAWAEAAPEVPETAEPAWAEAAPEMPETAEPIWAEAPPETSETAEQAWAEAAEVPETAEPIWAEVPPEMSETAEPAWAEAAPEVPETAETAWAEVPETADPAWAEAAPEATAATQEADAAAPDVDAEAVTRASVDGDEPRFDAGPLLVDFDGVTVTLQDNVETLRSLRLRLERLVETAAVAYRELKQCHRQLDAEQAAREQDREHITLLEQRLADRTRLLAGMKAKLGDVMSGLEPLE